MEWVVIEHLSSPRISKTDNVQSAITLSKSQLFNGHFHEAHPMDIVLRKHNLSKKKS